MMSTIRRVGDCGLPVRFEFIGTLPCALGVGHAAKCRVDQSTIDVARLCRLSRYESALQKIASQFGGDCGEVAAEALEFER